jgi:hypothetical protein
VERLTCGARRKEKKGSLTKENMIEMKIETKGKEKEKKKKGKRKKKKKKKRAQLG